MVRALAFLANVLAASVTNLDADVVIGFGP
jgi:hypothetical protein